MNNLLLPIRIMNDKVRLPIYDGEIFLQIPEYAVPFIKPYYLVSNFGRVYTTYYNKFVEPQLNENGYLAVGIVTQKGRIHRKVHRLELSTFNYIPGCEELQVNHKDGRKINNMWWNLEWLTPKENILHGFENGLMQVGEKIPYNLTEIEAIKIGKTVIETDYSLFEIANILNYDLEVIYEVVKSGKWYYLFTELELSYMINKRNLSKITPEQMHGICKYFQNNKGRYSVIQAMIRDALVANALEINQSNMLAISHLYYRLTCTNISSLYDF